MSGEGALVKVCEGEGAGCGGAVECVAGFAVLAGSAAAFYVAESETVATIVISSKWFLGADREVGNVHLDIFHFFADGFGDAYAFVTENHVLFQVMGICAADSGMCVFEENLFWA
jgi:hypothetical protein